MDEISIISRLAEIFNGRSDVGLEVGIGDDAAVFRLEGHSVVVATDILTEGTHFDRRWSDLYSIGRKAAAANLADIFAMGIEARYLLVAVAFPAGESEAILDLGRGIADESALVNARVIGGDLARSDRLTVAITAMGERLSDQRIITRSGAGDGDGLYISSLPGRSALGLAQLQKDMRIDETSIAFHRAPSVAYQEFIAAASFASSMCDLSDGISIDAASLARSSKVAIDIESALLQDHPHFEGIAHLARQIGVDPIEVILTSGEEHSPLFTAKPDEVLSGQFHRIGRVRSADHAHISLDGAEQSATGFKHFE